MFRKFRHCLYEMGDEIFHYGRPRHVTFEQILQIIFFLSGFRILFVTYIMATGFPAWHSYHHDVLISYLKLNATHFDYSMCICTYLFNVVYLAMEFLCFREDIGTHPVWKWWWQICVQNQQLYNKCLLSQLERQALHEVKKRKFEQKLSELPFGVSAFLPELIKSPLASLLASCELFYNLENADLRRLANGDCSLPIEPKISWPLRRQTLRISLVSDYIAYCFQLFIVFVWWSVILLVVLTYPNWSTHSWPGIVWSFSEVSGAFYVILRLIRFTILFTTTTVLGTVTFTGHLLEGQKKMEGLLAKYDRMKVPLPRRFKYFVDRFLDDHSQTVFLVLDGSKRLFGSILLGFIYTQIPMNVLLIRRILLFSSEDPTLAAVLALIVAIQLSICASVLLPFAWCQQIYHRPKRFIFRLQGLTKGEAWLTTKANYEDLYGRLVRGPKLALAVGPLSEVTYFSVMELLLSYIAYLLLVFDTKF